jgi:outer membrane biosynthesis protein TonB
MNRLQKKCLVASSGLHGFALLLLVFGSAFFVAKEKPLNQPKLQFVPSRFVEAALAGGGGNPNVARTDDVQKGVPTAPVQHPAPPTPAPEPERIQPPPPKPEPPKPEKVVLPKPEPTPTKVTPKPVEAAKPKPADKPVPTKPRIELSDLKPVDRTASDKRKAQKEAEAKEADRQQAAASAARQKLAQQIGKATASMQRGFQSGTKVDVGGPGGEAYANYGAWVQAVYEDAWKIPVDLDDDDALVEVKVTIAKDGTVIGARIIRRANSGSMNKSVQRALDAVKSIGQPFPAFIKDAERSFTIEFNLKAKPLLG